MNQSSANILSQILGTGNGEAVSRLASQFGMDNDQATRAIGSLLPQLTRQMRGNMGQGDGLASVISAIQKGNHKQYLEQPETLERPETVADGNAILGHILGSKERSREVADNAAGQTGFDVGILKQMLPLVAGMLMGGVSKQAESAGLNQETGAGSGLDDILGRLGGGGDAGGGIMSYLDLDGDGSSVDDIIDIAKKFL